MTVLQKMYIFYDRHFGVRKPHTDKFYYPKPLLYKVLKFLGPGPMSGLTQEFCWIASFPVYFNSTHR